MRWRARRRCRMPRRPTPSASTTTLRRSRTRSVRRRRIARLQLNNRTGRWGVKLEMAQPSDRDATWRDAQIGLNYGVAPGLRTGVGVSLGDEADAGRPQADQRRRRAAGAAGNHLQVLAEQRSIAAKPAQRPCDADSARRATRRSRPARRPARRAPRTSCANRSGAQRSPGRGAGARKHRRDEHRVRAGPPRADDGRSGVGGGGDDPASAARASAQRPMPPRARAGARRRRRAAAASRASAPASSSKPAPARDPRQAPPARRGVRRAERAVDDRRRRAAGGASTASGFGDARRVGEEEQPRQGLPPDARRP